MLQRALVTALLAAASLIAQQTKAPPKRPARPVMGLRILSTTISPDRDIIIKVQNVTNKTVVGNAVLYIEFDKDGNRINPLGAGLLMDYAGPPPNPGSSEFILPGQIGQIGGYHANLETVTVEARITGVVYDDRTAEGEKASLFFVGRLRDAQSARNQATKEASEEKRMKLEKRAEWYEQNSQEVEQ
jgi:hypothetical protein